MKKANNTTQNKVLSLSKITVSVFAQTASERTGKNQFRNDSVTCLPTTSSVLV
jgi:hypothetical protein